MPDSISIARVAVLRVGRDEGGKPDPAVPDVVMAQCLDALPEAIFVLNPTGKTVFFNRAAYRYFGPGIDWSRSPEERDHLFHPDDRGPRREARERALKQGLRTRHSVRAVRIDYAPRWQSVELTPLFDRNAMIIGAVVRMTDIHEQRDRRSPAD